MKAIIQMIFLFFSISLFGQVPNSTTIALRTEICRQSQDNAWYGSDTVFFYKIPEDTIAFKIITPNKRFQFPILIEKAQISEYRCEYKNIYNQQVVKRIPLTNQSFNIVSLCYDSLLTYSQTTLYQLQKNDSISIRYYSQGCFHAQNSMLIITKKDDKFIAKLYNFRSVSDKKKRGNRIKFIKRDLVNSVILTESNISHFMRFENELKFSRDGDCTTKDMYVVKSKFLNLEKTDGNCDWNGFSYLCKSFFAIK